MLSAIAVNVKGEAGPGFFELARMLGKFADSDRESEQKFWETEKNAVYFTWKVVLKE